jgi:hypothetical protein
MARIFLLRVGTELDFEAVNLQVRELGFASDTEKLYLGTTRGNIHIPTSEQTRQLIRDEISSANSAYDIWLEAGNEGTIEDFLSSLKGSEGKSTYQVWLDLGNTGTEEDFINSLGANIPSFHTVSVSPVTPAELDGNNYYEIGRFDYLGESIVKISAIEFSDYNTPESGPIEYLTPYKYSVDLYIEGGLATPSDSSSVVVKKYNISRGAVLNSDGNEMFYYYFVDVDGSLVIYIDQRRQDSLSKATFSVFNQVSTETGISVASPYYNAS